MKSATLFMLYIKDRTEYVLRPVINGICWNELLNFRVNNIVV